MNIISPRMRKQSPKRTESGARPLVRPCVVSAGGPDSLGENGVPCGSRTRLNGFADHRLNCSANGTESESADGMRSLPPAFDFPRDVRSWAMHAQAMVAHYSLVRRKPGLAPGPSPSQGEMLLLHHNPDGSWSPWSDSHRRIRVYKTRPVAGEAQERWKWRMTNGEWRMANDELRMTNDELRMTGRANRGVGERTGNSSFGILHSTLETGALTWICTTNLRLRRAACRVLVTP